MSTPATAQAAGTQTDFARAQGWSKGYVSKLASQGRLVLTSSGQVDFAASLGRIKATSGAAERAAPPVQGPAYADSQDRERFYSAELKRLELERQTGRLRAADEVASGVADAGALIRAAIEGWRDRLPSQLAALGCDEQRIASFLAGECEHLLQRMAQRFAEMAHAEAAQAGGGAE